jgi:Ca2+-binding EF-hand superfamily protein
MVSLGIELPNLKRMFELFDTNADGVVDMKELVRGLSFLRESGNDPSCMVRS